MKRNHMRKITAILLSLILALSLAACGGGSGGGEKGTGVEGKYMGDQVNLLGWQPVEEVYEEGDNYIELKSGGKGEFCIDGDSMKITWKLDGENLTMTSDGADCTATLKDGVIITDLFGVDIKMSFVKPGATAPVFDDTLEGNLDEMFSENEAKEGEMREFEFGEGAYTATYPAWIYEESTYFDELRESAADGFSTIEFTVLKTDDDVQTQVDFMNNAIDEGAAYDLEETELYGYSAQKLIVTDEYDMQVMYALVQYDEDMGAAGVGLYIEVDSWETIDDTSVVMDILNSIVIN